MKPSSFPEFLQAPVLALATTLAACTGTPATQLPERTKQEAPAIEGIDSVDPAVRATNLLERLKQEIHEVANREDATTDTMMVLTPSGASYLPTSDSGLLGTLDSLNISGGADDRLHTQVDLSSGGRPTFSVKDRQDGHLSCVGPENGQNISRLDAGEWTCKSNPHIFDTSSGALLAEGPVQDFTLEAKVAEDFFMVKSDIRSMAAKVEEKLRIVLSNPGGTPVQGE